MPAQVRRPFIAVAAFAAVLVTADPLEAQYRRGVVVYEGSCALQSPLNVRSVDGGWEMRVDGRASGVRSLNADAPVRVTAVHSVSGNDRSVTVWSNDISVLVEVFDNPDGRCSWTLGDRSTQALVTHYRTEADKADREVRSWTRVRNLLILGGVGILGATGYYTATADPIELLPVGLGLGLGAWVASLGGSQAQPEIYHYRRQRDYNRSMEQQIIEQAR